VGAAAGRLLFIVQTWIATDLAHGMRFSSPRDGVLRSRRARRRDLVAQRYADRDRHRLGYRQCNGCARRRCRRILFAMARDRKLPTVLASVHPRYQTPYVSTLVVAAISLVVGLFFTKRVDDLESRSSFLVRSRDSCCCICRSSNHYFIRERSGDWLRHLLMPLGGLLVIGYVLYQMDKRRQDDGCVLDSRWYRLFRRAYLVLRKPAALEISDRLRR